MRVAAFTGGLTVPSARFRVRQFVPLLAELGIELDEMDGHGGVYPPPQKWRRPLWAARRLAALSRDVIAARRYDTVMLQREMISSYFTLERFTPSPRILDVDDAIHLLRGGGFARKLAQISDRVIAGNAFLAEWYRQWNPDVVVLPTAVDADRYVPAPAVGRETVVIGWIGTSANFGYLETLAPALARVAAEHAHVHIRIVSDREPALGAIAPDRWSFVKWREASEIGDIQSMDIGIMPLADSPWARGKCSFKMLQYMACGLPVVVSPVGMNADVLAQGDIGFGPRDTGEWVDALDSLITSSQLRSDYGARGRSVIEAQYSARVLAPQLARHLNVSPGAVL